MPLSAAARLQGNSGVVTSTGFTPTLPNPTTQDSTLLLWWGNSGTGTASFPSAADPPWYADLLGSSTLNAWRRPNQPAGETSWTISGFSTGNFVWRIEEWAGWSTVGQPDAAPGTYFGTAGSQNNNASNGGITADVSDFAALAVWRATNGSAIWPLRTYSSGWSEVDVQSFGTGTGSNDFQLMFAEAYPGASGTLNATLTWDTSNGGTYTGNTVNGWLACYQPALPLPAGVLTA